MSTKPADPPYTPYLFTLPVVIKRSSSPVGYLAMFPNNRLHINGWGKSRGEALDQLNLRAREVILGTRNVL